MKPARMTLADYREIYGDRYTDEELEEIRRRLRGLARVIVATTIQQSKPLRKTG